MEQDEKAALLTVGAKLMELREKCQSEERRRRYFQMLDDVAVDFAETFETSYFDALFQMDDLRDSWKRKSEDKP